MNLHTRVLETGLLGGPQDARTRRAWPPWAREHVRSCVECQVLIQAARLLSDADAPEPDDDVPSRRAPTVEELRKRRRPVASIAALAANFPRFGSGTYRGGALELAQTTDGVRAWDPDARHLLLFSVGADDTQLLGESSGDRPGVGVEVAVRDAAGQMFVALGLPVQDDPEIWRIWLGERQSASPERRRGAGTSCDRVHYAELVPQPRLQQLPLRLSPQPFPPPVARVAALLDEAAAAAGRGDMRTAIPKFAAARAVGFEVGDAIGMARGGIGLGNALTGVGFLHDAGEVLASTIAECDLDLQRASQACLALAWRALHGNDVAEGERWLGHATRVLPSSPWLGPVRRHIAFLRGAWADLIQFDVDDVSDGGNAATEMRAYRTAIAWCRLGEPERAVERIVGIVQGSTREVRLWRLVARACLERARSGAWGSRLGDLVLDIMSESSEGDLSRWESVPLAFLIQACADEARDEAAALLRVRFLQMREHAVPVFALAGAGDDIIAASSDGSLVRLSADRASLLAFTARMHQDVVLQRDARPDAAMLADVFFPNGCPGDGLIIASDGLLAGVPWPLLLAMDEEVPPVTEALGRGAGTPRLPTSNLVRSFADPAGDLPMAALDCGELGPVLRGSAVTHKALHDLGELGLLHLGLHVRRTQGVPELVLADGPMTATEIAELRLHGNPIVLLAGCGSSDQPRVAGVERSLSDAFLRAGASAVVATRWPLTDREAHAVFRPLLTMWPFTRAEQAVATVATALRRTGHPPRVWASLAVYRS